LRWPILALASLALRALRQTGNRPLGIWTGFRLLGGPGNGIMAAKLYGNINQNNGFESWLQRITDKYEKLTSRQRLAMLCRLVDLCSPSELYEYSNYVTDMFRRDFISLLPAELVDHVLSYVDPESLLRACCVGIRMYIIVKMRLDKFWSDQSMIVSCSISVFHRCFFILVMLHLRIC